MAENKFSDKEIIKALENKKYGGHSCVNCKYGITKGEDRCGLKGCYIARNALDLINRQQKTIERLKGFVSPTVKLINEYDISVAKIEAIKEFASEIINDLLPKTMVGYDEKALELSLAISNKIQEMEAGTNECS